MTCPELSIVATAVSDDAQGVVVAAVAEPVNCVVKPSQTFKVPVILGVPFTVTTVVITHPLLLVYVIVVVPAPTPVTNPELSTVATAVSDDVHALAVAAVAEPVNCVVNP